MARAFVAIGSNLGDRARLLQQAVDALRDLPHTDVVATSTLRDTDPVGIVDQPRFLNGVVELQTLLEPRALLEEMLRIELDLGRRRDGPRGGPRTVDLDLLLYEGRQVSEPGLEIPHPRLHERRFVLEPLAELDPALDVPGKGRVQALLAKLDSSA